MPQSFKTEVVLMASTALVADTLSSAGNIVVASEDLSVGTDKDAQGSHDMDIELDVTTAPTTATRVELYEARSSSKTAGEFSDPKLINVFQGVKTTADQYRLTVPLLSPACRYYLKSIGYGLTATLNGVPITAG